MPELHAFFDKDVLIKLACCDLWDETLTALNISVAYRLPSATPNGCEKPIRRRGLADAVVKRAMDNITKACSRLEVLPEKHAEEETATIFYNQMLQVDKIDSGEALLASVALSFPEKNKLITGDKRFVEALMQNFPDQFEKLKEQIVVFESCLLKCCEEYGFDYVKSKVLPALECDGALRMALRAGENVTENEFREALLSYTPDEVRLY